ncbi:MAG: sigma-54-dependent Fis family transcriptional regulator, partial [Oligoflexia bacterium]|nr:sigma-54-dependent Fis family transcriptional regulator [Oligoflexia bacterium]
AIELFQQYDYPGNVRELENLIERVVILSEGDEIQGQDIAPFMKQEILTNQDKQNIFSDVSLPERGIDMEAVIGNIEKELLVQALQKTNGMKKPAADLLGLSLRSFRYRLQKYQLGNFLSATDPEEEII